VTRANVLAGAKKWMQRYESGNTNGMLLTGEACGCYSEQDEQHPAHGDRKQYVGWALFFFFYIYTARAQAIGCCLFPVAHCLLYIAYCLLPIAYCLLPIVYCLLSIAIVYCLLSSPRGFQ
jgi:hypothetical protein